MTCNERAKSSFRSIPSLIQIPVTTISRSATSYWSARWIRNQSIPSPVSCLSSRAILAGRKNGLTMTGNVTKNCILKSDLSTVPKHLFKKKTQPLNGQEYWELNYKLLISIDAVPMVFSLQIGGKEYGQVGADY